MGRISIRIASMSSHIKCGFRGSWYSAQDVQINFEHVSFNLSMTCMSDMTLSLLAARLVHAKLSKISSIFFENFTRSNCLIYIKSGNIVRGKWSTKSRKIRTFTCQYSHCIRSLALHEKNKFNGLGHEWIVKIIRIICQEERNIIRTDQNFQQISGSIFH